MATVKTKQRQGEIMSIIDIMTAITALEKKAFSNAQNMYSTGSLSIGTISIAVEAEFSGVSSMLDKVVSMATILKTDYALEVDPTDWNGS